MSVLWKYNWESTKQHFLSWWKHEGMVLELFGDHTKRTVPHADVPPLEIPTSTDEKWVNAKYRAMNARHYLAYLDFPVDNLPLAKTSIGPGSLALYLGSEPSFSEETVWFNPCISDIAANHSFEFDPNARWFRIQESIIREIVSVSDGNYFTGCPDLIENIDILASLRDTQVLLMDMIENPEWVEQSVLKINQAYFDAYDRIHSLIQLSDGSSIFCHFNIWGPGKTIKTQCDASAMFSPEMYSRFVLPALIEQCEWADNTLYHLDGPNAVPHLDILLSINALDAIQWVPGAGNPDAGDPIYYPMYKKNNRSRKVASD
ncbi:MAG: hypothetical protein HC898_01360 [Phycisphaerales bacterium]|nr:hypothetical protein [Phycisphaerales bacterium]